MPDQTEDFGRGLWELVQKAIQTLQPDLREAAGVCIAVMSVTLLIAVVQNFPEQENRTADFVGAIGIATLLLGSAGTLISLGADTVQEISAYGTLLLPVMTSALAAQGGLTASAALYTGTAVFNSVLSSLISRLLVPMVYLFLAVCVANTAVGEDVLAKIRQFIKWLTAWCLKIILYAFTGYISITGVVSGSTDASVLKAAKLTISGMVPVVGGILSDASEAVLVGAGTVKNAAGIYGILAILAVCAGPFCQIGVHYLLLKATGAVCSVFGSKGVCDLISDFSTAMGLLLAMTGSMCLLFLISIVCFLQGVR